MTSSPCFRPGTAPRSAPVPPQPRLPLCLLRRGTTPPRCSPGTHLALTSAANATHRCCRCLQKLGSPRWSIISIPRRESLHKPTTAPPADLPCMPATPAPVHRRRTCVCSMHVFHACDSLVQLGAHALWSTLLERRVQAAHTLPCIMLHNSVARGAISRAHRGDRHAHSPHNPGQLLCSLRGEARLLAPSTCLLALPQPSHGLCRGAPTPPLSLHSPQEYTLTSSVHGRDSSPPPPTQPPPHCSSSHPAPAVRLQPPATMPGRAPLSCASTPHSTGCAACSSHPRAGACGAGSGSTTSTCGRSSPTCRTSRGTTTTSCSRPCRRCRRRCTAWRHASSPAPPSKATPSGRRWPSGRMRTSTPRVRPAPPPRTPTPQVHLHTPTPHASSRCRPPECGNLTRATRRCPAPRPPRMHANRRARCGARWPSVRPLHCCRGVCAAYRHRAAPTAKRQCQACIRAAPHTPVPLAAAPAATVPAGSTGRAPCTVSILTAVGRACAAPLPGLCLHGPCPPTAQSSAPGGPR